VATIRERPNDILLEVKAARTGRSTLTAKGAFTGIYGYGYKKGEEPPTGIDLRAEFSDAADALSAVAARRAIPGLRLGGDQVHVQAHLSDAFERLKIDGSLDGLDAAFGSYEARAAGGGLRSGPGVPMGVTVKRLAFSSPQGGQLTLSASLKGPKADAKLSFARFVADSYVPAGLRKTAAGTLDGGFRLTAKPRRQGIAIDGLDLRFARRFGAGLPRNVGLRGRPPPRPTHAATRGITIELPGASVTANGRFDLARQGIGLALRATASDLPRLLGVLGLPPLARLGDAVGDVAGTTSAPEAKGSLTVRQIGVGGLPEIGALDARFSLADGDGPPRLSGRRCPGRAARGQRQRPALRANPRPHGANPPSSRPASTDARSTSAPWSPTGWCGAASTCTPRWRAPPTSSTPPSPCRRGRSWR
jgi:hypothetical protein